ncbi:L-threonylcarbamoyladenylate synthase [Sphingobium algorifonticola]|uniref:Threonylcarbamoyl-AMP synthase n=1 Tax=Sphingobium algorifonticola TaxID=2008318 RepID=A0A437J5H1_9SPHN|nr:L-threonylcarbamoyladenylate synthase [Sphingobium algorifonticola]RVT39885.1 threonylcarbamoyl-AMP synthase [Sphingobium algorifonticola]
MTISQPIQTTRISRYDTAALREAAALIRAGEPVAVPTETVYGLAADATDDQAVAAIYAAKGRPSFNPLIVHVADRPMAERIALFAPAALALANAFWPGPLTLVLPLRPDAGIAPRVTAGLPTIALRLPAHPAMIGLIRESGKPLAAPSANRSGGISPTRAEHVLASIGGRIRMILDAGPTSEGLESTIVAPENDRIRLLRPGSITAQMLERACNLPVVTSGPDDATASIEAPGQMASHYAPGKPLRLDALQAERDEYLIGFGLMPSHYNLSADADIREAAANLFAALHLADASAASRIAIAPIPHDGIGAAINDRLRRAAA